MKVAETVKGQKQVALSLARGRRRPLTGDMEILEAWSERVHLDAYQKIERTRKPCVYWVKLVFRGDEKHQNVPDRGVKKRKNKIISPIALCAELC